MKEKGCNLCPRNCFVDRESEKKGYCGQSNKIYVARAALATYILSVCPQYPVFPDSLSTEQFLGHRIHPFSISIPLMPTPQTLETSF